MAEITQNTENNNTVFSDREFKGYQELIAESVALGSLNGTGDAITASTLGTDAWGRNKVIHDHSLVHGVWTYDVSDRMWVERVDGDDVAVETNFTSENGMLKCVGGTGELRYLHSRRHPRYQPNRGHLYSSSMILPDAALAVNQDFGLISPNAGIFFRVTTGKLYAVRRTTFNSVITDTVEEITIPDGVDLTKGNVYDIQMQWRGVGNIKFFVNLELVHTLDLLGTLDAVSIHQPALPIGFVIEGAATMYSVCADITSEGGSKENRQYLSCATSTDSGSIAISGYNDPVIAIRVADIFNGSVNNRDAVLTRVSGYADQRCVIRVWLVRDTTALAGGTWSDIYTDNIQVSENITAIDPAKAQLIHSRRIDQDQTESIENPDHMHGEFYLSHGDHIIITIHRETGGTANAGATIEMAEEI